jgi:hypothetical protein
MMETRGGRIHRMELTRGAQKMGSQHLDSTRVIEGDQLFGRTSDFTPSQGISQVKLKEEAQDPERTLEITVRRDIAG